MTKKKVLRKVLSVIYWLMLAHLNIRCLLGDLDTFLTVYLIICDVIMVLNINIVVTVCCKIIFKAIYFKQYKEFLEGYHYLKDIHNERYKLYFSSDKEKIGVYTQKIQSYGELLLRVGNYYINNKTFSKKKTQEVQEIIDKTKELMQKEFVTY